MGAEGHAMGRGVYAWSAELMHGSRPRGMDRAPDSNPLRHGAARANVLTWSAAQLR